MALLLAIALEYWERELSAAESAGNRRLARAIGERLCELNELADFTEFHELHHLHGRHDDADDDPTDADAVAAAD